MSFDDDARTWDDDPAKVERSRLLANEIKNFLQPNGTTTAFEFGCGTGLLSFFLKDDFQSITLADTSSGMIDVLKEKIAANQIQNMHPFQVDLLNEPYNFAPSHVIYTLMTLHHIHDISSILSIFNQLLLPGGHVCVADLETEDGSFHARHPNFDGHKGFDRKDLENKFRENGLEPVYYNNFFTIQRPAENGMKSYPLFVMIGRKV